MAKKLLVRASPLWYLRETGESRHHAANEALLREKK
jgi:hypothetical protein